MSIKKIANTSGLVAAIVLNTNLRGNYWIVEV